MVSQRIRGGNGCPPLPFPCPVPSGSEPDRAHPAPCRAAVTVPSRPAALNGLLQPPRLKDPLLLDRLLTQDLACNWLIQNRHVVATITGVAVRAGALSAEQTRSCIEQNDPIEIWHLVKQALEGLAAWLDRIYTPDGHELPLSLSLVDWNGTSCLTVDMGCGLTAYRLPLQALSPVAGIMGLRLLSAISYATDAFITMQDAMEYWWWPEERLDEARLIIDRGMIDLPDEQLLSLVDGSEFLEGYDADSLRDLLDCVADYDSQIPEPLRSPCSLNREPKSVLRDVRMALPQLLDDPTVQGTPWEHLFTDGTALLAEALQTRRWLRIECEQPEQPFGVTQIACFGTLLEDEMLAEMHESMMFSGEVSVLLIPVPSESLAITEIHEKLSLVGRSLGLVKHLAVTLDEE